MCYCHRDPEPYAGPLPVTSNDSASERAEPSSGASLMALLVKNLPTMQETLVRFLGREDPLEEEMATHSSTLAWRIPWTESLVGSIPWGHDESNTTERLNTNKMSVVLRL